MVPGGCPGIWWDGGVTPVRSVLAASLAAATVALVGPTATAAPAATSCTVKIGSKSAVAAAAGKVDAVFAASVKSVSTPVAGGANGSATEFVTAHVISGFKGSPRKGGTAAVGMQQSGRQDVAIRKGATYLFFADQKGAGFTASLCGGAVRLRKGLTDALATQLKADLGGSSANGQTVTLSEPSGGVRDLPALSRIAAPGAGVALFGLLGLLFVRRLGRERS